MDRKKSISGFSEKSHPISHPDKTIFSKESKEPYYQMLGDDSSLGVKPFFHENPMTPTFSGMSDKNIEKGK
jgi:hypothetical protein